MGDFSHRRREEVVGNRRDLFYPVSIGWNCLSSEASPQNAVGSIRMRASQSHVALELSLIHISSPRDCS